MLEIIVAAIFIGLKEELKNGLHINITKISISILAWYQMQYIITIICKNNE